MGGNYIDAAIDMILDSKSATDRRQHPSPKDVPARERSNSETLAEVANVSREEGMSNEAIKCLSVSAEKLIFVYTQRVMHLFTPLEILKMHLSLFGLTPQ